MSSTEPRTFSEQEHLAILADRVATETASLNESLTSATVAKTELETKLDVLVAEKAAAEKAAAEAVQAFEDFKTGLEAEKAAAEKKEERLVAVKAAATHLPEEFFADEARIARVLAYTDEQFEGYVADLAATNAAPAAVASTPKETAMSGTQVVAPVVDNTPVRSAAYDLLLPALSEGGK